MWKPKLQRNMKREMCSRNKQVGVRYLEWGAGVGMYCIREEWRTRRMKRRKKSSQGEKCLRGVITLRMHRALGGSKQWFIHSEGLGVRFAFLSVWCWY